MRKILIAGCGDVGCELAVGLKAKGDEVWGLRRSPDKLPRGIYPVACDLSRPLMRGTLPAHIDQVVFLPTPGARQAAAYRAVFVDGLCNLLQALALLESAPSRLVFVSSTSVYGQHQGEYVDENSMTEPAGFAGRTLLEAESIARQCPIPSVVVRLAGIYGPGRRRLIDKVRAGARCSEYPVHYTNRIHRDDCAGVLDHVLQLPEPADTYIGVDNEPAALCSVMDWMASQLGVAKPVREPPAGDTPYTGKRCRNTRLTASGYRFKHPDFRSGYHALLAYAD